MGSIAGALTVAAMRGVVVAAAMSGVDWTEQLWAADIPWTLVLVGLGELTIARILRTAAPLQVRSRAHFEIESQALTCRARVL